MIEASVPSSTSAHIADGSLAAGVYGATQISERHRHRYEVNNDYRARLRAHGLAFSATSPDGKLVEMIELPSHTWFVAGQFHPELKSRPTAPHPLFASFVEAAAAGLSARARPKAVALGG